MSAENEENVETVETVETAEAAGTGDAVVEGAQVVAPEPEPEPAPAKPKASKPKARKTVQLTFDNPLHQRAIAAAALVLCGNDVTADEGGAIISRLTEMGVDVMATEQPEEPREPAMAEPAKPKMPWDFPNFYSTAPDRYKKSVVILDARGVQALYMHDTNMYMLLNTLPFSSEYKLHDIVTVDGGLVHRRWRYQQAFDMKPLLSSTRSRVARTALSEGMWVDFGPAGGIVYGDATVASEKDFRVAAANMLRATPGVKVTFFYPEAG